MLTPDQPSTTAADRIMLDDDQLETIQFTTPFTFVPFTDSSNPLRGPQTTATKPDLVSPFPWKRPVIHRHPHNLNVEPGAAQHSLTAAPSVSPANDISRPQKHAAPPSLLTNKITIADAEAANWGSHHRENHESLHIEVSSPTEHVVLEVGDLENHCDKIIEVNDEPIYCGLKE